MGSFASMYSIPWYHGLCYAIGVALSWFTMSAIHGAIYIPVYTPDFLLMLGIGVLYYIPVMLLSPIVLLLFEPVMYTVSTRGKRSKLERETIKRVEQSCSGHSKEEIIFTYPFLDGSLTWIQMVNEIVKREMDRVRGK